jgi:regulatory protein YycH of two-component signal transduction system YycFG
MKYVEPIKSFLLFFLVALSLTLTVMIWNYKPNHQVIDKELAEDVAIGSPIELQDTMRPYRTLSKIEDMYKGSTSNSFVEKLYGYLNNYTAADLALVNNSLSEEQINDVMRVNNRLTLFYGTEIPLKTFTDILAFESEELPQMSFDRLILDWNDLASDKEINVLFLNTEHKTLYRTSITNQSEGDFKKEFIASIENFLEYEEFEVEAGLSHYVTVNAIESVKYMYYINELSVEQFKEILFPKTKIVRETDETEFTQKYRDDSSFMTIDTKSRILNYVHPASEGLTQLTAGDLLADSFQYVNDHGGFNADFRVMNINRDKHVIDYQMFYQGLPIFSSETATKITTTWGNDELYKYRRPFYTLEIDIPGEMEIIELPAGKEILPRYLQEEPIRDLILGYNLVQNKNLRVFELVPTWFVLKENTWERINLEEIGGIGNGLE